MTSEKNTFPKNSFDASNLETACPSSAAFARRLRRRVQLAVRDALGGRITRGGLLVVAFSGGPDSTALALALHGLQHPFAIAHLDHSLRESSHREAEGPVRAFAERLGAPCLIEVADVAALAKRERLGIEDAGRIARYDFLERVRRSLGAEWILLGHQADDLAEDVLLRLVRGAGWPALAGMKSIDPERRLLRPFLHLPKTTLQAFVDLEGESCLADPSNNSENFRRNRLRHNVIPLLKKENPSLFRTVGRLWELAREDESFWRATLAPTIRRATRDKHTISLPENEIRPLHRAARLRLYTALLRELNRSAPISPRADTLLALDNALLETQRPKSFQFHGGAVCILAHGHLVFSLDV